MFVLESVHRRNSVIFVYLISFIFGGSLEMFMTEDQKKYYAAMKKMQSGAPQKAIPRPKFFVQGKLYDLTMSQKFDILIMTCIVLNMVTMCMEHAQQTEMFTEILLYINYVFLGIFTMECVLKIFALRWHYFTVPWNVFDFVVVVISILTSSLADVIADYLPISPTMLRVLRVFRVGRILRLVKSAKGIRTLLFSLMVSLPALLNIGLLLVMVMFIFSTFGMAFFMHVKFHAGVDEVINFQTFFRSMITLFQISTSAGWAEVLTGLMQTEDLSNPDSCVYNDTVDAVTGRKIPGNCGNPTMAVAFLISYLLLTFLVVINMYIAVILENFSQATEEVQQGLTSEDFDMFYEKWGKYDPKATGYMPLSNLSSFVTYIEEPLQIKEPNWLKLCYLNMNICVGDKVHCKDVLDTLTKNVLGTVDIEADEMGDQKADRGEDYEVISTLQQRQREIWYARIIQRRWKDYIKNPNRPKPKSKQKENVIVVDIEEPVKDSDENQSPDANNEDNATSPISTDTGVESDAKTVELYPDSGSVA